LAATLHCKSSSEEWNPRAECVASFRSERLASINSLTNYPFGSHAAELLALAVVILLALELCVGTLEFVSSLLTHERDAAEPEKDYWRIHGGE
jgi:hypothetical protein